MKFILVFSLFLIFSISLANAEKIREERAEFKPGETGATIKERIKGRQIVRNVAFPADNQASQPVTPADTGPVKYDAHGEIKCSADKPALNQWCEFRVLRDLSKHSAEIWITNITFKDQVHYRVLYFADGTFSTNDKAQLAWQRQGRQLAGKHR